MYDLCVITHLYIIYILFSICKLKQIWTLFILPCFPPSLQIHCTILLSASLFVSLFLCSLPLACTSTTIYKIKCMHATFSLHHHTYSCKFHLAKGCHSPSKETKRRGHKFEWNDAFNLLYIYYRQELVMNCHSKQHQKGIRKYGILRIE